MGVVGYGQVVSFFCFFASVSTPLVPPFSNNIVTIQKKKGERG